jgi:hypothetical protein
LSNTLRLAAGIHPTIVRLSEGLQGSSLNAGSYTPARRIATDMTVRSLWGTAAASLAPFVPRRTEHRLWYDDRDIPFLREDAKDEADIFNTVSLAVRQLIEAGYEPDAAVRRPRPVTSAC